MQSTSVLVPGGSDWPNPLHFEHESPSLSDVGSFFAPRLDAVARSWCQEARIGLIHCTLSTRARVSPMSAPFLPPVWMQSTSVLVLGGSDWPNPLHFEHESPSLSDVGSFFAPRLDAVDLGLGARRLGLAYRILLLCSSS